MLQEAGSLKAITETEKQLGEEIGKFTDDPYGYVLFVFPWGQGELADMTGPDEWQTELLKRIRDELHNQKKDALSTALRVAVASGHGVGKTALVSWLIHWFISTRPNSQIVVTANTQNQLSTKTWRELAKWSHLAINRHWFVWTATKFYHTLRPDRWYASAIPWSKDNSQAFAGTHETTGVLYLFDEASTIEDIIWEVSEGAMTTPGAMWFAFGNPTETKGKFFDCFNTMNHRWITYKVDSRKAKMANQKQIQEWIEDYGEDSDFVKIRVKGEFPRVSAAQFIPTDVVVESLKRQVNLKDYKHFPVIIGVDVARYGDNKSIIIMRQGNYIHEPILKFSGLDTMELASKVTEIYRKFGNNGVVCVDGVGVGSGVVDRLKKLGINVIDCQSAEKPIDQKTYRNKRGEYWGRMKDWLINGGKIPNDEDLKKQLPSVEYGINNKLQIQLQTKEDMRKHGIESPDVADALSFTFAYDDMKVLQTRVHARPVRQVNWF